MRLKGFIKGLLLVLGVLLILVLLTFTGLFIFHQVTREDVDEYLPADAMAYVQIDSIDELYNSVIDLKALEILLTRDEWNSFYQALLDYKTNVESRSFLFQQLLKMKANVIIHDDYSPSLILDPRMKGMLTRFGPGLLGRMRSEDISLTISAAGEETVYTLNYKNESDFHIIFKKNLIFLSLDKDDLLSVVSSKNNGEAQATSEALGKIEPVRVKDSILDMFVDVDSLLTDPSWESLFDFPSYTSLSVALSNQDIDIKWSADLEAKDNKVREFLACEATPPGVVNLLPQTTNIYGSVNFKSFKDFYDMLSEFSDDFIFENYDGFLKFLLGMNSEDILFSWTGSEAGFYSVETAPEPVVFIKTGNEEALDRVLERIDRSLILNVDTSLVIDDVRVSKFNYSGVGRAGIALADVSLELPYFIRHEGYLFLSMNPEVLAGTAVKGSRSDLLVKGKTYKTITSRLPGNSNLFFYYDLNSVMPRFIADSPMLFQLLSEYEQGIVSLYYTEDKVTLYLSAENAESSRTTLFPGYPKDSEGLAVQVFTADVTGGSGEELIYLNDENRLFVSDMGYNLISTYDFRIGGTLSLTPRNELFYNSEQGWFFKLDGQCSPIEPFPLRSEVRDSFSPIYTDRGMIFYSSVSEELQHYSFSGDVINRIEVPKSVFSQPLLIDDRIYYYPKSLMGTIYGSSLSGETADGWPRDALGVSFSTPFYFAGNIGFLTQKGSLHFWSMKGEPVEGFPVELPGVYYSTPAVLDEKKNHLALISSEGLLTVLDENGNSVNSVLLDNLGGKDTKLTPARGENLKEPVLFVYGSTNYMTALNRELEVLPGFPLRGYTEPYFSDINRDGYTEFVTAGYDKKIYIYTLRTGK